MRRCLLVLLAILTPGLILAQSGLDPASILKPLGNDWPIYAGDYTSKRYSDLKLINQSSVRELSLAWVTRFTLGSGPYGFGPAVGGRGGGGGGFG